MAAVVVVAPGAASASVSSVPDVSVTVTGTVYAMVRIGNRTIIGGDFTAVGGVTRHNAAAIRLYEQCGFTPFTTIEVHRGTPSQVLTWP